MWRPLAAARISAPARSIKGKPLEYAIKIALLKSLKRARIRPNRSVTTACEEDYTHFTSPIRRYADLIVHRSLERHSRPHEGRSGLERISGALRAHLRPGARRRRRRTRIDTTQEAGVFPDADFLQAKGERLSRRAFWKCETYGLFVELPEFLISGLVHVSALDDDFYMLDAANGRFVGKQNKTHFSGRTRPRTSSSRGWTCSSSRSTSNSREEFELVRHRPCAILRESAFASRNLTEWTTSSWPVTCRSSASTSSSSIARTNAAKFVRITEEAHGRRNAIIIPSTGLADFVRLFDEVAGAATSESQPA